jgi:LPS export ABC transporter protein LptC
MFLNVLCVLLWAYRSAIFGSKNVGMIKVLPNLFSASKPTRVAVLAFTVLVLAGCENNIDEVRALSRKKIGVETAEKVTSFYSQGGKMKAKLTAPYMERHLLDTPKIIFPRTLHVDFYDKNTQIESRLDAKYAQYLELENKVVLRNNVRLITVKGDTLFTNELFWDQTTQLFYTQQFVSVHTKEQIIEALGMQASNDLSDITFFKIIPTTQLSYTDTAK